jgi:molybdopterin-guanine dinucleotide biosynthesis protein A/nucleoside-triphosphatase THEP1
MSKVVILSGAVQSGKTTSLLKHFSNTNAVGGFICPDVNGKRMMFYTSEKRVVPFQITQQNNSVSIGKFAFDQNVFNKACDILVNPLTLDNNWVIVDEVGPLELKEKGYYHSLITLIDNAKQKDDLTIILVVREHLIADVVSKFNLKDVEIITKDKLLKQENFGADVTAVILSGGESSRMKTDKFLLKYDGVEQYKRLLNMFDELNLQTFLSCNENQYSNDSLVVNKIVDNAIYKDAGPLTGILSAFDHLQSDLLIVGCDYPLLKIEHLRILKQFSEYGFDEIAFVKNDRVDVVEPLICFLSKQSLIKLKQFYVDGGRSLNKYLQQINPLKIQLNDDSFLRSFDTPEDYHSYCNT